MKKLFIIIPAYNEEKYIRDCLISLQKQDVQPERFEVVVVNNASTDTTKLIIQEFGFNVIDETKKGYVNALHTGYKHALDNGADWLATTNADSRVPLNWVRKILEDAEKDGIVGVTGPLVFWDAFPGANLFVKGGYSLLIAMTRLFGGFPQFSGPNMAFSVDAYHEIGGIDVAFNMSPDVELSRQLSKIGEIYYDKRLVVKVSSRRFKEQPLTAMKTYAKGLFAVLRGKSNNIEWDDVR